MKDRSGEILQAIVGYFIETATPVGSEHLRKHYHFPFSSATIRNEMSSLEREGYIYSPHTSAGRAPTERGFQFFVANAREDLTTIRPNVEREFSAALKEYLAQKEAEDRVFDAIKILTKITPNVAFATIPRLKRTFFLGISNILSEPEFLAHPQMASGVLRVLESNFELVLQTLDIGEEPKIFIGKENIIPEISSCSLIVSKFPFQGTEEFLGILGPMRMDYGRNIVAIEQARDFLLRV